MTNSENEAKQIMSYTLFELVSLMRFVYLEYIEKISNVFNPLSANATKWSNALTQGIIWMCFTILWGWRLKCLLSIHDISFNVLTEDSFQAN